jgi:type I restriction enzyme M protein
VGLAEEADDFNFTERFSSLKAEFENQLKEEAEFESGISAHKSDHCIHRF